MIGTLGAIAWMLLVFFAFALVACVIVRAFEFKHRDLENAGAPGRVESFATFTAEVTDRSGRLLERLERRASLTEWVQVLLVFANPFHPEPRKTDEVYLEILRNLFTEMEADRSLVQGSG